MGQKAWDARETLGVQFEMGKEIEKGRGEFNFWIFCSHWWLQKGKGKDFEDIVNSESNKANIEKKVAILNGKKLLSAEFHEDNFGTVFDFDDDIFLRVAPYGNGKKDQSQWQLGKGRKTLVVQADGHYFIEEPDE